MPETLVTIKAEFEVQNNAVDTTGLLLKNKMAKSMKQNFNSVVANGYYGG